MKMRLVKVFEFKRKELERGYRMVKTLVYIGKFHQWGVDYEEFEGGPGNFSTAIIEKSDGTVEDVYIGLVDFLTDEEGTLSFEELKKSLEP